MSSSSSPASVGASASSLQTLSTSSGTPKVSKTSPAGVRRQRDQEFQESLSVKCSNFWVKVYFRGLFRTVKIRRVGLGIVGLRVNWRLADYVVMYATARLSSFSYGSFSFQRRLQKELMSLVRDPPDGMTLAKDTQDGEDLTW